jgi:glutamate synthase domain-containing protein 2
VVTHDEYVIMASEAGVLDIEPEQVKMKGRLQPGKMFLVDTGEGRIVPDKEIKHRLASRQPYAQWLKDNQITIDQLPAPSRMHHPDAETLLRRQRAFGYSDEDLRMILGPMASKGQEPVGSMGTDTPLACLSDRPQSLFNYFKQLFAQVTNPPIDPIREEIVMSLISYIGAERNILSEAPENCHMLKLAHPLLTNIELEKLRRVSTGDLLAITLPALFRVSEGEAGLKRALEELCQRASLAGKAGYTLLILSDRGVNKDYAPIPSLLALAAVHNLLVQEETRTQVALITESGEPREVMHFALLSGYGASAINPYMALESVESLARRGELSDGVTPELAVKHFIKSVNKGLLKTFAKMGISTLQSYQGAQVFEAIGLNRELVDSYFAGTASRLEGVGLDVLAREAQLKHEYAFRPLTESETELAVGGNYHQRVNGEYHLLNPLTISKLQQAVRQGSFQTFQEYTDLIDNQSTNLATLRSLMKLKKSARPVPIEEVEPAKEIVKRFNTGAMSFGSISKEAHETLAIAMNRIGGKSNTGEGGEDEERFKPDANGDLRRSAVKQVASARFGVTANYLVNADELQIKMAQGAKPGEGGQLPGHKVDEVIARLRHPRRGFDFAAASPRYLFHRRPGAADLRPEECESASPHCCEVGRRSRSGHGGGGRCQGACGCRPYKWRQRRYGRFAVEFDQARRHSLGTGVSGDAAGAVVERSAQPNPRADGRQTADRARCRYCRAARRRRVRLRHHSADCDGLRHDAQVPSQHLLGGHRHPGSRAAQAISRAAGARHQLLLFPGRTGAAVHGRARRPPDGRYDRARRHARRAARRRSLEGTRSGSVGHSS